MKRKFIIWAPSYDETVGGIIALHTLCDRLNEMGIWAGLWPDFKPPPDSLRDRQGWRRFREYSRESRRFERGPFEGRVARYRDLPGAIVLYPEIVSGNPLGLSRVVRWLLYHPGFHTGEVNFGSDDLCFFYQDNFDDPFVNPDRDNLLRVTTYHPAYKQRNFGERRGSCYLVRKGVGKELNQHPAGAVQIDTFSHEQKSEIFNRSEYFYSYDPYTFYSVYAALCGCTSIVIPDEGVTREQWHPSPRQRFGLAYGVDEIPWAVETRPALLERIGDERKEEDALVQGFVEKCRRRFK